MRQGKENVNPFTARTNVYACPAPGKNKWQFAKQAEELRPIAKRTARSLGIPVTIFRVLNGAAREVQPETFLIVRRVVGIQNNGEKDIEWAMVDTEQAANTLRDVSFGPTPYLPLRSEETLSPG